MFTGIIEETGIITQIRRQTTAGELEIQCEKVLVKTKKGDSIAVNGVCLTVTDIYSHGFRADVMPETMQRSSFSNIRRGDQVNLERAMPADGRFGGHLVSGHIDGIGTILAVAVQENAVWYTIAAAEQLLRYMVEKGSVALDGISLTIAGVCADSLLVSVIPHTRQETNLRLKQTGDFINIECDVMGKYIEKLLTGKTAARESGRISEAFLMEHGF